MSSSTHPSFIAEVQKHGQNNYKISISFTNPVTSRSIKKTFILHIAANTKNKERWSVNIVTGAVLHYMKNQSRMGFMNSASKREKGLGVYRIIKQATNRKGSDFLLQQLEVAGKRYNSLVSDPENSNRHILFGGGGHQKNPKKNPKTTGACEGDAAASDINELNSPPTKTTPDEEPSLSSSSSTTPTNTSSSEDKYDSPIITASREVIASKAIPTPKASIFAPAETGATFAMIGKSKSGKTTFVVNQLNRMSEKEVEGYNVIVFFTTSLHANPLKDLKPHVRKRMVMVGRFVPKVLQVMKRINDETNNKFKFLVIFDDILKLRGDLMSECILTLRNSNISTVISMQYVKLMSPAQRDSVHNIYIFNLKTELWEFMLRGFIFGNVKEEVPPIRPVKRVTEAALIMRQIMNPFILYHDQVNDTTEFYIKKS